MKEIMLQDEIVNLLISKGYKDNIYNHWKGWANPVLDTFEVGELASKLGFIEYTLHGERGGYREETIYIKE
jgi:hypothetical protein